MAAKKGKRRDRAADSRSRHHGSGPGGPRKPSDSGVSGGTKDPRSTQPRSEWVGGYVTAPFFITGEGEPFRPQLVLWFELPEALVVGQQVVAPGEEVSATVATLLEAMEHPMAGTPRRPQAIRVADPAVAAEVRSVVGAGTEVVTAETPELDEIVELMAESMPDDGEPAGYLEQGTISPESVEAMFSSAKRLYMAEPWTFVEALQTLRLDIPDLGVEAASVSIFGALGECLGFAIFPSDEALDDFLGSQETSIDNDQPADLGSSWLMLRFVSGSDLPDAIRREAAKHAWPVADASAYPLVQHLERDAIVRPLSERDLAIVSACASFLGLFCLNNRELFEQEIPDPVCESYREEEGPLVRFTAPYEALSCFDIDDMDDIDGMDETGIGDGLAGGGAPVKVGRNDPCPCGSGKKYKKCHMRADSERQSLESEITAIHELDQGLLAEMVDFAYERFERDFEAHAKDFRDPAQTLSLILHWAIYHFVTDGRCMADRYTEEYAERLHREERAWLAAERAASLSLWEVREVEPGQGMLLEDLLTGESRQVHERSASTTLMKRDVVLGRIVDHHGLSLICGMHPRPLPPLAAAKVVERMRRYLRRKRAVPVDRLRNDATGRFLIKRWEEAVDELDLSASIPPTLYTSDGEPMLLICDHFEIAAAQRGEVERRIAGIARVKKEPRGGDFPAYVFFEGFGSKPEPSKVVPLMPSSTVHGCATFVENGLEMESYSERRADRLRQCIEEACNGLIKHKERSCDDPLTLLAEAQRDRGDGPGRGSQGTASPLQVSPPAFSSPRDPMPELSSTEKEDLLRRFKHQHYATWPDTPLPALDGNTPRESSTTAAGRTKLDVLLKDMENHEQRLPAGERYDFSRLRRELGLES